MTKLIFAFRNFSNSPKNIKIKGNILLNARLDLDVGFKTKWDEGGRKYSRAETPVVEQSCCGRTRFSVFEYELQLVLDHMCTEFRLAQNATCIGPSVP